MSRTRRLETCSACGGFVPAKVDTCPHCATSLAPKAGLFSVLRASTLGGVLGGGALAFTLMACYGCPDCEYLVYEDDVDGGDAGRARADAQVAKDTGAPDATDASPRDAGDAGAAGDGGDGGDADAAP